MLIFKFVYLRILFACNDSEIWELPSCRGTWATTSVEEQEVTGIICGHNTMWKEIVDSVSEVSESFTKPESIVR